MSEKLKIMQTRAANSEVSNEQDLFCASIGYPDLKSMRNTTIVQTLCGGKQPSIANWDVQVDDKTIDIEDLPWLAECMA